MTYRERRERKAARLREWAAKREARAHATLGAHAETRHDWAFVTQPGHIPERARLIAADDRAHASIAKSREMQARADAIERQTDGAIYSDDPDAIEALRARIASLEAKRARIAEINRVIRSRPKNVRTDAKIDQIVALGLAASMAEACFEPNEIGQYGIPSYVGANLSGNIRRNRERLAALEQRATTDDAEPYGAYSHDEDAICVECGFRGEMRVYKHPNSDHSAPCPACGDDFFTEQSYDRP